MIDKTISLGRQIIYQLLALFVLGIVLFPVLWVVSMALDPRDLARPTSLVPPGASLKAFREAIESPTPNPVSFGELARNSLAIAAQFHRRCGDRHDRRVAALCHLEHEGLYRYYPQGT